jgi:hypothetical protein
MDGSSRFVIATVRVSSYGPPGWSAYWYEHKKKKRAVILPAFSGKPTFAS